MIREARGVFDPSQGITPGPVLNVGVGFGRGRVFATPALVDTGSDLCVFPTELLRWSLDDEHAVEISVEEVRSHPFDSRAYFPTITAGDIRLSGIASIFLPGADPLLGRSFLNRCELRLSQRDGLVLLRRET